MPKAAPERYRSFVADSARWEGFPFRPGDIVISTPNKCGTTWTQMICALLIFQSPELDRPLDVISPWLDMLTRDRDALFAALDAQGHRRFIKSHTPLDGLPWDDRVTYVCVGRDPRDAGLSFGHHMANLDFQVLMGAREAAVGLDDLAEVLPDGPPVIPDSEIERFRHWVEDPTPPTASVGSLALTLHHLATFWAARSHPNVVLLHYEDLAADLEGQMRSLADRLGIEVPADRWPELVEAARFEQMRERADELAPESTQGLWQDNRRFFNRGVSRQWSTLLDDGDVQRYAARVKELADADLLAWLHRTPVAGAAISREA